jgi:hypothetical protein
MDSSGNKKPEKTTITKRGGRKLKAAAAAEPVHEPQAKQQQFYDADAALALALSNESYENAGIGMSATGMAAAAIAWGDECERERECEIIRKHQEEADAEMARLLAEQFAAEDNPQPTGAAEQGDDMDAVLEEIARVEAQERLRTTGHAYKGKTNIDRILEDEDAGEARIREQVKRQAELRNWREERDRQDAEFAAAEEADRLLALTQANRIPTPEPAPEEPYTKEPEPEEPEPELTPLTKEELRKARLAFFTQNYQTKTS